jgi:heterodisulfide reductase subunit A
MNIAGVVDVEQVMNKVENLPNVATAKHYVYMCSQPGQDLIKNDIKELGLNRVVVASCSPRMHEPTYQKALEEAGVNPFFFEMANIREQVSWAHMNEPERATEKAADLIRMAIARASLLEPIGTMEVPVTSRALVLGAGVAGITAASDLAEMGFAVTLVEKEPYVGGHLALLNTLPWDRDASEVFTKLSNKLSNPKISLRLNASIKDFSGYIGNFEVTILQKPNYVDDKCNRCGQCEDVCPISIPNPINAGLDQRKAIYLPSPTSYPPRYVVDRANCSQCGQCVNECEAHAIDFNLKPLEMTLPVGMVVVTTGFTPYIPDHEFGYNDHDNVITQLTLERLLASAGPTHGKLLKPSDKKPSHHIAFIMCVGSRESIQQDPEANTYCSRYCCSSALKNALHIKTRSPRSEVYVLYRDIRTFERGHEELYRQCREHGVLFIRYTPESPPQVQTENADQLTITVKDYLLNANLEIPVDLLVLVEGMVPRDDADEVRSQFSITRSADGFFQEAHAKMNPLNTFAEGIFIGGTCQGPKDIEDTVLQASGAAAKAAIYLNRGKVVLDLVTAAVDQDLCTGCGKCTPVCPYQAIELDDDNELAVVTEVKCKGCGSCSATCPVGAVQLRHFQDQQILAMVEHLSPLSGGHTE